MKFTQAGGEIKITMNYDWQSELLELEVVDNGSGIEQYALDKLFSKFSELSEQESSKYFENGQGIGMMGLSICKKIVERSGGQMNVFSRGVNQGTTFSFSMKMKLV